MIRQNCVSPARAVVVLAVLVVISAAPAAEPDAAALARKIDDAIAVRLKAAKLQPAPLTRDDEFLRRVWLDLAGTTPPYASALAFLQSTEPNKRAALIDELLASDSFANHFGMQWGYRVSPPDADAKLGGGSRNMAMGFADGLRTNQPWDKMIQSLLTATGRAPGPGLGNRATEFYGRYRMPDQQVDAVGAMFLGLSLQCAQCHHHPFDPEIKQDDYWGMAAFFFKFNGQKLEEDPKQDKPKELVNTAKIVPAKWLGGESLSLEPKAPRRPVLAEWLTAKQNPYFAKAFVNRVWMHMMGRGLLPDANDIKAGKASHPELLQMLTECFTAADYDIKYLYRAIALSQTYQRSSAVPADQASAVEQYAFMPVRPLTVIQLFEIFNDISGKKSGLERMSGQAGLILDIPFEPDSPNTQLNLGLSGMLLVLNSEKLNIRERDIARLILPKESVENNVDRLFVTLLARLPSTEEKDRFQRHIAQAPNPNAGYADVVWVLTNSTEFLTNR